MNYMYYVLASGVLAMLYAFLKTNWIELYKLFKDSKNK